MKGSIKLGSIVKGRAQNRIKLNNVNINFKTIPLYIESENRIMERKEIIHSHEVFQNEKKKTVYGEEYMNTMFNGLYRNRRNYSFDRPRLEDYIKERKLYLNISQQFIRRPPSAPKEQLPPVNREHIKRKLLKFKYKKCLLRICPSIMVEPN